MKILSRAVRRSAIGLIGVVICSLLSVDVRADHFRGGILRGQTDTAVCTNGASFTVRWTVRRSQFAGTAPDGFLAVGDVVPEAAAAPQLNFGDSTLTPALNMRVIAIDIVNDTATALLETPGTTTPGRITRCYAAPGTYTAFIADCCTVINDPLNPNTNFRVQTTLTIPSTNQCPTIAGPTDVAVEQGGTLTFAIPAVDPEGDTLSFRLATAAESAFANVPPGLNVNSTTGVVSWAVPVGQAVGPYNVQFVVQAGSCSVPYSLVINVVAISANNAPAFNSPPTPCGQTRNVVVGQQVSFTVSASDPDTGNIVTLSTTGLPAGATFTPTPGNPATGTFTWTPGAPGNTIVTFQATDRSLTVACSVTIAVAAVPVVPDQPIPSLSTIGLFVLMGLIAVFAVTRMRL